MDKLLKLSKIAFYSTMTIATVVGTLWTSIFYSTWFKTEKEDSNEFYQEDN